VGGDAVLAEDLTQETYVAAVCDMRRRGEASALSVPWVIAVARHKLVDHFRRLAREERKPTLVSADAPGRSCGHWLDGPATDVLTASPPCPRCSEPPSRSGTSMISPSPTWPDSWGAASTHESLLARGRDALRRRQPEHAHE